MDGVAQNTCGVPQNTLPVQTIENLISACDLAPTTQMDLEDFGVNDLKQLVDLRQSMTYPADLQFIKNPLDRKKVQDFIDKNAPMPPPASSPPKLTPKKCAGIYEGM
ncbi:uncharacterized protein LOC129590705 [Paramacrobiotus metropolitanus]|uniref:uncharacterized protein LOC129590705 n=1 Tax=Paramacrobiotus metropolitanus TaxID=2943436 RepID=UPI002445BF98|nr:uncharacterized protein LOC129590705 [Paramacrobiotus metropolitanus]